MANLILFEKRSRFDKSLLVVGGLEARYSTLGGVVP